VKDDYYTGIHLRRQLTLALYTSLSCTNTYEKKKLSYVSHSNKLCIDGDTNLLFHIANERYGGEQGRKERTT